MSNSSNQVILTWEIVEARLRRSVTKYRGNALDPEHNVLVMDAYSLWYLATDDLLFSWGVTHRDIDSAWLDNLVTVDVHDVFCALKIADSFLLTREFPTYETFKRSLRTRFPFIGLLLAPMKRVLASWFETKDHDAFRVFHSWASFPARLNLPGLNVMETEALSDYLARESSLPSDGFTEEEGDLITTWYPRSLELVSFFEDQFEPHHGPGGTADAGRSCDSKYRTMGSDLFTDYLDKRVGDRHLLPRSRSSFERTAKLVFVPKSMLTYRSISMESATLMWYQQGVLKAFNRDLRHRRNHPLHDRFHPSDQQSNRDLAWEGSIDGSFATIDLSAASDSVSWPLVKKWFRKSVLYRWMLCTRSSRVLLPNGKELAMKKYAPMGSALCFPTECIVFAAITECAIREAGGDPCNSRYRVYGDDIVVESEFAPTVIARLKKNGFEVNSTKTFSGHQFDWYFRESCGGEYLDGMDVTPPRLSRWFSGLIVDVFHPGRVLSLIELANDCYSQLPSVRRRCIAALNTLPCESRPRFCSSGEGGVYSPEPTNYHLSPPVWSQEYQRYYWRHGANRVKNNRPVPEDEDIRLFEYLRLTRERRRLWYPEDSMNVDITPTRAGKWSSRTSPVEET